MPRLLFEKKGNAVWMSHLDLMRLFQRAFKRAGLPLKHTQGFNPRPSVSIALPLSVGVESNCEILDFELDGMTVTNEDILTRLNSALVNGVSVLDVYENGQKIKNLAFLQCRVTMEYDNGIPECGVAQIRQLFAAQELIVEKHSKNGVQNQNIIPMIRTLEISMFDNNIVQLRGVICCQNPTLNPSMLTQAIERYLPQWKPDFSKCCREEIFDHENQIFR